MTTLNNLKENYDIVKLNNNNLTNQKKELETRINELNNSEMQIFKSLASEDGRARRKFIEDYKKMYGVKTSKTYSFFKITLNILTVLVILLILYAVGLVVYAKFIAPLF